MSVIDGVNTEAGLEIWLGIPGSGKSYCLSDLQVRWLEAGMPVLSNLAIKALPFRLGKKKSSYGEFVFLQDADFIEFDMVDGEPQLRLLRKLHQIRAKYPNKHYLVCIDEAHNFYASQDWKGNPKALKVFLTQHRHLDTSVICVTQNETMVDNHFQKLCQSFRYHRNLAKDPFLKFILFWFSDNYHVAYSWLNVGGKPFKKEPFDRKRFKIKRRGKDALYSTSQMHASHANVVGNVRVAGSKVFRWVGLLIMLAILGAIGWTVKKMLPSIPGKTKKVAAVAEQVEHTAQLDSFHRVGDWLVLDITDGDMQRQVFEPYTNDKVWELEIGEQISVKQLQYRPLAEVVTEAIKGAK